MKPKSIPSLCRQIWQLYGVVNGEGKYYAKEEKEKLIKKIKEKEKELRGLLG
jgi:hypothetical protein